MGLHKGYAVCPLYDGFILYQWHNARLVYLQCFSNGDTTLRYQAINTMVLMDAWCTFTYILQG